MAKYELDLLEVVGSDPRVFRGRFHNPKRYSDNFHWMMGMPEDMPFEEFILTLRNWADRLEEYVKERPKYVD